MKDANGQEIVEKSAQDNIEESLSTEIKEGEGKVKTPEEIAADEQAAKDAEALAEKNKDKTPEQIEQERVEAEAKAKKDAEDSEFDLGLDEDGKTPLKLKRSQILELRKNGMLQSDYTKKTQELAAEKANLKELVDIVEFLKKNPAKAEKIIKILEEKAEEAAEVKVDLKKSMEEIETLLKDLPEDDPYAKVLRGQKAILQESLKVNQKLSEKLESITNGQKSVEQSKLEAEAHQTLVKVMGDKQKALKFIDDKEAEYWKKSALTYLLHNRKEYSAMDTAQFTKYFNQIGDKVYAEIVQIGEGRVNKYIKEKGGASPVPGSAGSALPADKTKAPITQDNLESSIEQALESGKEKEES